jgi:hypothetical protein
MVYCQQSDDGVTQAVLEITVNKEGLSDAALLARKAESAARYGWTVQWVNDTAFTATKVRGLDAPRPCVRQFWIGA